MNNDELVPIAVDIYKAVLQQNYSTPQIALESARIFIEFVVSLPSQLKDTQNKD